MTTRPSAELRPQIEERAHQCCEYCLVPQDLAASRHQVDHVIAEKHGGQTTLDNLALSCTVCNRRKGSDIGSLDPDSGTLIPLFNPRTQPWSDHFQLDGVHIKGIVLVVALMGIALGIGWGTSRHRNLGHYSSSLPPRMSVPHTSALDDHKCP